MPRVGKRPGLRGSDEHVLDDRVHARSHETLEILDSRTCSESSVGWATQYTGCSGVSYRAAIEYMGDEIQAGRPVRRSRVRESRFPWTGKKRGRDQGQVRACRGRGSSWRSAAQRSRCRPRWPARYAHRDRPRVARARCAVGKATALLEDGRLALSITSCAPAVSSAGPNPVHQPRPSITG